MVNQVYESIHHHKVVAVIRHNDSILAEKMVEGVIKGGIRIIELTRTIANVESLLQKLAIKYPDIVFGIGTIINLDEAKSAVQAGAQFLVSPWAVKDVINFCQQNDVLYIPGIMTLNEIQDCYKSGSQVVKLFPGDLYNPKFIVNVLTPLPFLKIMPSGGVNADNAKQWLDSGAFAISLGSNLVGSKNATTIDVELIVKTTNLLLKKIQEV